MAVSAPNSLISTCWSSPATSMKRKRATMDIRTLLKEAVTAPTPEKLASSPLIDGWWIIRAGAFLRAQGQLAGHPTISDPFVTTSPIMGFDDEKGWMRTRSRYYRLGWAIDLGKIRIVDAVPLDIAQDHLRTMREMLRNEISGVN